MTEDFVSPMKEPPFYTESNAIFSECKKYRYALWRIWDYSKDIVTFICLNPSTADQVNNDPTVIRCINYAQDWDYGGMYMMNLFAYRATKSKDMMMAIDPVGPANDRWLKEIGHKSSIVIAAWGVCGGYRDRDREVIKLIGNLYCLILTKEKYPGHPLYLKGDLRPKVFVAR